MWSAENPTEQAHHAPATTTTTQQQSPNKKKANRLPPCKLDRSHTPSSSPGSPSSSGPGTSDGGPSACQTPTRRTRGIGLLAVGGAEAIYCSASFQQRTGGFMGMPANSAGMGLERSRYLSEFAELERLGRGGFGSVFKVRNLLDGCIYAVKRIRFHFQHGKLKEKLHREVTTHAKLSHPNIVRYHVSWIEHSAPPSSLFSPPPATTVIIADDAEDEESLPPTSGDDVEESQTSSSEDESDSGLEEEARNMMPFEMDESSELFADRNKKQAAKKKHLPPLPKLKTGQTGKRSPPGWKESTLYIQMHYYEETLSRWLKKDSRIVSRKESLDIFRQIVEALEYIHSQGVIHRDLKPANIFLSKKKPSFEDSPLSRKGSSDWLVSVGDFGLATFTEKSEPRTTSGPMETEEKPDGVLISSSVEYSPHSPFGNSVNERNQRLQQRQTTPSSVRERSCSTPKQLSKHTTGVGTCIYASPEQISKSCYDEKTDIWSLGMIFFELLNKFSTEMERAHLMQQLRQNGQAPASFQEKFPAESELIRQCLNPDPSQRPSARDILSSDLLCEYSPGMNVLSPLRIQLVASSPGRLVLKGSSSSDESPSSESSSQQGGGNAFVTMTREDWNAFIAKEEESKLKICDLQATIRRLTEQLELQTKANAAKEASRACGPAQPHANVASRQQHAQPHYTAPAGASAYPHASPPQPSHPCGPGSSRLSLTISAEHQVSTVSDSPPKLSPSPEGGSLLYRRLKKSIVVGIDDPASALSPDSVLVN